MSKVGDYYTRDPDTQHVLPDVLMAQISESIRNPKHVALFGTLVADAVSAAASAPNVRAAVLMAKQQEVSDKLAQALTTGHGTPQAVDELIEEVKRFRSMTALEEIEEAGMEVFADVSLRDLIMRESDPTNLIKVYPQSLNDRLDGGAKRGHHIVVYGRPESMKTGTVINIGAGAVRQGFRVLHFINEDRPEDIIVRKTSNLSGLTKHQIYNDPERAERISYDNGGQNYIVINAKPGSLQEIENEIERYEPDVIIVDQLRNIKVKADNRVNQLEYAATGVRNIGKKCNVLAISVTQAGDSAEGKAVLDMGDVDYSNTGIPAQADVMIGVGVTPALEAEGRRMFSLPKNKVSGNHDSFPVNVVPPLSRVKNV